MFRHINPVKTHPERITWKAKKLANDLDHDRVGFPVQGKDFSKIETKNNMCIDVSCSENKLVFPIYISNQKYENSMNIKKVKVTFHVILLASLFVLMMNLLNQ